MLKSALAGLQQVGQIRHTESIGVGLIGRDGPLVEDARGRTRGSTIFTLLAVGALVDASRMARGGGHDEPFQARRRQASLHDEYNDESWRTRVFRWGLTTSLIMNKVSFTLAMIVAVPMSPLTKRHPPTTSSHDSKGSRSWPHWILQKIKTTAVSYSRGLEMEYG